MPEKTPDPQPPTEEFLGRVGQCVRGLRASRGMTRKQLSQQSAVSERYLANLEQGQGNISIGLLRRVAAALGARLTDLFPAESRQSPEHALISEFVGRLSREDQQLALQVLYREFADVGNCPPRIALIGLRGAGKTTLGRLLEARQGLTLVRLAEEIERLGGMKIGEIHSLSGQTGYRRLESSALVNALNRHRSCCIETGGSIVSGLKELNLLLSSCLVVWIRTTPDEHMARVVAQGDLRPMADNADAMDDLRRILEERTPYYRKAHIVLETTGKTVEASYQELVRELRRHGFGSEARSAVPDPDSAAGGDHRARRLAGHRAAS